MQQQSESQMSKPRCAKVAAMTQLCVCLMPEANFREAMQEITPLGVVVFQGVTVRSGQTLLPTLHLPRDVPKTHQPPLDFPFTPRLLPTERGWQEREAPVRVKKRNRNFHFC